MPETPANSDESTESTSEVPDIPGLTVSYESEMELDAYDLAQRLPDSVAEPPLDADDRSRIADLVSADMDTRLMRDPVGHGDITVAFDDEDATSTNDLDLSAIGVFYIVPDTSSVGRTWLFRTIDQDEAVEQYEALTDSPPHRIYFEGTLEGALQGLLRDNSALLAE